MTHNELTKAQKRLSW